MTDFDVSKQAAARKQHNCQEGACRSMKSLETICEEWRAIEENRPGGSLPNLQPIFDRASSGEFTSLEKPLLDIIEILHRTICSYHAEMGTLLDAVPTWIPVTERLPEPGQNVLVWTGQREGRPDWDVDDATYAVTVGKYLPRNSDPPELDWKLQSMWYELGFQYAAYEKWCWMPLPDAPSPSEFAHAAHFFDKEKAHHE